MHMQCETVADVLRQAEDELCIVSAMQDRAAWGNHPIPITAADYLAWWEDEAEIQEDNAASETEHSLNIDAEQTRDYAAKIKEFCADLRELGIKPTALPWAEDMTKTSAILDEQIRDAGGLVQFLEKHAKGE